MLKYSETNWKSAKGLETKRYNVTFNWVKSQRTVEEQKERPERLSLVKVFTEEERRHFIDICVRIHNNDAAFHFDKDKIFHTTLIGFPVLDCSYYNTVMEKIRHFCDVKMNQMWVRFNLIRLGTKYEDDNDLKPVPDISNGTLIAFGDCLYNTEFTTFGNTLVSFLLDDGKLNSILGSGFRRRFPSVWCTMGYYVTDFKITTKVEKMLNKYRYLEIERFHIPCTELELGKSHYRDLRDWKTIRKFVYKGESIMSG